MGTYDGRLNLPGAPVACGHYTLRERRSPVLGRHER